MLEIGSLVDGKYKILSEIGHGGMSVVYMALNEKANKTWAVKEVRKDGVLDFEAVKQGLIVETDMLKKLNHPNLPSIVDVIEDDETFLIVMDYVEGHSLSKALEEYGAQPQEHVIEWAKQLCDVLGYLHSREPAIIYRDMKPANVMLNDGKVTLIDFGTAREFKEKNLADTTCLGTIGYAAPEQFGGMGQTDARTDIYCLGATLYHLVTGHNPSEPPYEMKPIRQINPSLSTGLEKIIQKCTQKDPNERYQSAAELMYALEHYKEFDDEHIRRQRRKLGGFIATSLLTVLFALGGFALDYTANLRATDSYQELLDDAKRSTDYAEKLKLYDECLSIPNKAGEKDAYLGLVQAYKEDQTFSVDEANQLSKYIKNNKEEIQKNPDNYTEICFEVGKLYWYFYEYSEGNSNQITNAISSIEWFSDVLNNAGEDYAYTGVATVYSNIGIFYRDITTKVMEASDNGTYKPLYDDLWQLLNLVAVDATESEIVRLELLELSRSALQQYATKFKGDGVTKDELLAMYNLISETTNEVEASTDKTIEMKNEMMSLLEDTKNAIEVAFGTSKGGN